MASGWLNRLRLNRQEMPWWFVLVLWVPLLVYLPGLNGFPYPNAEASFSDVTITHYPYGLYLQRAIFQHGHFPLWAPGILSGAPFFANPLAGLWYPPGWLALLFPLPLGFNLLVIAHLLLGGVGMLRLLQAEGLDRGAALWGALAFEALPKLAAHFGAGHLTLLYAVPWTPWLLLFAAQAGRPALRSYLKQSLILALIFLADPRWCVLAGILWAGYRLAHLPQAAWAAQAGLAGKIFSRVGRAAVQMIGQVGLAVLLAAPLAVPLLELVRYTTRRDLASQDLATFALPLGRVLGLLYPDLGGFHEYMLYGGQAVLFLTVLALLGGFLGRGGRFWAIAAGAALIWSVAAPYPPLAYLARLPGMDLLRVPSRALFILGLSLAALSAYAVHALGRRRPVGRAARLAIVGLLAFSLVLTAGVTLAGGKLSLPFLWGTVLAGLSAAWLGLRISARLAGRLPGAVWLLGLFLLGLADWAWVDRSLFVHRPAEQVLGEAQPLAEFLSQQAGPLRIYSPSYSLPQQTAAFYGLQLADGVDPLQLSAYVHYMQVASGIPWTGYSVTLPPFANGEPALDNAAYRPDPARLGSLNISYVAAEFDLDVPGLDLVQRFGQTRVYANRQVLPRAWVQAENAFLGNGYQPVERLDWSPDQITLQASGPGLLVLSELAYPGWRASVDGRSTTVETVGELLRGVHLLSGSHEVVFSYRPLSLGLGLGLAGLGIILWIILWLWSGRQAPAENPH